MEEFQSQIDAFAEQIEQELRDGVLSFPTVFDLSLRIKRLADDPDSSLTDIANAVKAEPVLAAKVIRMANTLSMNPYRGGISSLKEAITRIGLSTLRCLAFAVAAEQLARDHRSRQMRLIATGLWMQAIDVASWAFSFARERERANPEPAQKRPEPARQRGICTRSAMRPCLDWRLRTNGHPPWKSSSPRLTPSPSRSSRNCATAC